MLTIKEIFDICKEHGAFVDLSYIDGHVYEYCYMVKLYYGRRRLYRLLNDTDMEFIFTDRESFEKYVCEFVEEAKKKEAKE